MYRVTDEPDGVGAALFRLLCQRRGWSSDYLTRIASTDHAALKDVDTMAAALEQARLAGRKVTIAPDFDMDGIASGVLGYAGLKELGFDVEMHLPDYTRGHDLTPDDIAEIADRFPDTAVLLTCDGGVNSPDGIAAARALGWQTLVTDHHQELEPGSTADITVDPCRLDEDYALRGICGAHVLYQVLETYARTYQPYKLAAVRWLRLFAGLGTVSDVMPILFENRQLVRDSLSIARLLWVAPPKEHRFADPQPDLIDPEASIMMQLLRCEVHDPVYVQAFEGFALVLKAFAQAGKLRDVDDLDEGFYGFYLAPAMNSVRRTGAPMADCFEVFTAPWADEKLAAMTRVIENNELRKELTVTFFDALHATDQPLAPWVWFSEAPAGMLGLLANKLMQQSGMPTVVLHRPDHHGERISGSGRAPGWFDIIATLDSYEGLRAIGHAQACGVKVDDSPALARLADILATDSAIALADADDEVLSAGPDLLLGSSDDCDAPLADLDQIIELVRRVETLRPFGHGFPEPLYRLAVDPARCNLRRIGSADQHLRLTTGEGLACLWWNVTDEDSALLEERISAARTAYEEAVAGNRTIRDIATIRLDAKLQINVWNGSTRVQAIINGLVDDTEESAAVAGAA